MGTTKRRYPKAELAKRGAAIFEKDIMQHLKGRDPTDFVVIDIETNANEIGSDPIIAYRRLRKRVPAAQIWLRKVGSRNLCHFGGHGLGRKP